MYISDFGFRIADFKKSRKQRLEDRGQDVYFGLRISDCGFQKNRKQRSEDRGQRTESSWQIRSDAETRGHGDAERKDQRSEVGDQRSESKL